MELLDCIRSIERVGGALPLGLTTLHSIGIVACREQQFILAKHLESEAQETQEDEQNEEPDAIATLCAVRANRASE